MSGEDSEPVPKAATEKVSVQLILLSGALAWGPQSVNLSTTVGELIQQVAQHVGKPAIAIHLLDKSIILDTGAALRSLGVASEAGPITLQCSIDAMLMETQSMFDKFQIFLNDLNANRKTGETVYESAAVTRSAIDAKLKEISAAAGLDSLPADAAAWLRVLLCSGKNFCDYMDDFMWIGDVDWGGVEGIDPGSPGGVAAGGLIYVSIFGDNDNVLYWIIDAGGELAEMNGEEGAGAVYFAETWDDIWECEGLLTRAFWQEVKNNGGTHGQVSIVSPPKRVAGCLTDLFAAWMANGGVPGGRRGK